MLIVSSIGPVVTGDPSPADVNVIGIHISADKARRLTIPWDIQKSEAIPLFSQSP